MTLSIYSTVLDGLSLADDPDLARMSKKGISLRVDRYAACRHWQGVPGKPER